MSKVVVLDNGAYTIKAGYGGQKTPKLIPNCITRGKGDRRTFIGDQLATCKDYSGLYYKLPFEKGLLTNWEVERALWDRAFSNEILNCEPDECSLIVTEPILNLPNLQSTLDQIIFEEYDFQSYYRTTAPQLCLFNNISSLFGDFRRSGSPDCVMIVDSGYSFTHVVPFVKGKPILKAIRRINVGGKLLTNQLKEIVSFRHWDMMDETYLMNEVKETCCFVSLDFMSDLDICKQNSKDNPILIEYVLPDFSSNSKGYIKSSRLSSKQAVSQSEQMLLMNNERFTVPEILFHPSDIGMNQAGIPEVIMQSFLACDEETRGLLLANVVLVGGNANIEGFRDRVENDLRELAPDDLIVRVSVPDDPITFAWQGGSQLASSSTELKRKLVTRAEYQEHGSEWASRKFGNL